MHLLLNMFGSALLMLTILESVHKGNFPILFGSSGNGNGYISIDLSQVQRYRRLMARKRSTTLVKNRGERRH
jgi:hypothetical protein